MIPFREVRLSLADIIGSDAVRGAIRARAAFGDTDPDKDEALAFEPVSFFPETYYARQCALLPKVGTAVVEPVSRSAAGAGTKAFQAATHTESAPTSARGWYRIGEDGRLYLAAKSEHYHVSLGHAFPGYSLIDRARALGIPNGTHNNTRGHITRLAEEELVRLAHGSPTKPDSLNRVLNLQTGSLAVEAAIKLTLARFTHQEETDSPPPYKGRIPVFLVLGDDDGGPTGNYHGTTITAQLLRGLWPEWIRRHEEAGLLAVRAIRPDRPEDLEQAFATWDKPPYKLAAFFHEIIMMNYGARCLSPDFLHRAYELCARHDVLTVVDEIQSCVWGEGLFSFLEWDLDPSMVVVGKGFPGGEYAGSRIIFRASLDVLSQFGALVTNGQEELTSLAYLVTIRWVEANQEPIRRLGDLYEDSLRDLAEKHADILAGFEGRRHLGALRFHDAAMARNFARHVSRGGIDISVQAYKKSCPPVALTKLPLTVGPEAIRFVVSRLDEALRSLR